MTDVTTIVPESFTVQYEELKQFLKLKLQKPITKAKIFVLVAAGIKFAEQFKAMPGPQKKDLVLHAIHDVIADSDILAAEEKELMLELLDSLGDAAIDTLVDFGRDTVTFVKKGCMKCFTR
jgi:hypothetical protein